MLTRHHTSASHNCVILSVSHKKHRALWCTLLLVHCLKQVLAGTWNVNETRPSSAGLEAWLGQRADAADLVLVGLQVQTALHPSPPLPFPPLIAMLERHLLIFLPNLCLLIFLPHSWLLIFLPHSRLSIFLAAHLTPTVPANLLLCVNAAPDGHRKWRWAPAAWHWTLCTLLWPAPNWKRAPRHAPDCGHT